VNEIGSDDLETFALLAAQEFGGGGRVGELLNRGASRKQIPISISISISISI